MTRDRKKNRSEPGDTPAGEPEALGGVDWVTRSVRFPRDLLAWLEREAPKHWRSTQLQIIFLLEQARKRQEQEEKSG